MYEYKTHSMISFDIIITYHTLCAYMCVCMYMYIYVCVCLSWFCHGEGGQWDDHSVWQPLANPKP